MQLTKVKSKARKGNKCLDHVVVEAPLLSAPPAIMDNICVPMELQFATTAAVTEPASSGITLNSLGRLLAIAASSTTLYGFFECVRVTRVRIYGPPTGSSAGMSYVFLRWINNSETDYINAKTVSDRGNQTRPAYIDTRPPVDGPGRWWIAAKAAHTNSLAAFYYAASAGSIIVLNIVGQLSLSSGTTTSTGTGLTAGLLYYNYLDNNAVGGGAGPMNVAPIGRTITSQFS